MENKFIYDGDKISGIFFNDTEVLQACNLMGLKGYILTGLESFDFRSSILHGIKQNQQEVTND